MKPTGGLLHFTDMPTRNLLFKKTAIISAITLAISSTICLLTYYLVANLLPPEQLLIFQQRLVLMVTIISCLAGTVFASYHYYCTTKLHATTAAQTCDNTSDDAALESPIQILVVDDNPANRLVITNFLSNEGIATVQASSGEEAIRLFQENEFNMVFMDIEMSDTDGLEATQVIRSIEKAFNKSRTPIIGVSAHSEKEKMYQSLLAGFDGYMVKPVKDTDLHDSLKRWCDFDSSIKGSATEEDTIIEPLDIAEPLTVNDDTIAKVIDIEQSLSYSHNNRGLAKDMLELLIKMIRQEKSNLIKHYREQDWEALSLLTHKLHGGSCYCGVPKLQQSCETADKLLQKQQYTDIDQPMKKLIQSMEELLDWDEQYDIDIIFDV